MFKDELDDDFDDFDFQLKKPDNKNQLPSISANKSEGTLPFLVKDGGRDSIQASKAKGLPKITKSEKKIKPMQWKEKNREEEQYEFDEFYNEEETSTNRIVKNLEKKSKEFDHFHTHLRTADKHISQEKLLTRPGKREVTTIQEKQKNKNLSKRSLATSSLEPNRNKSGLVSRLDKNLKQEELTDYTNQDFDQETPKRVPQKIQNMPIAGQLKLSKFAGSQSQRKKQTPRRLLPNVASVGDSMTHKTEETEISRKTPIQRMSRKDGRSSVINETEPLSVSPQLRPKRIKVGKGNVLDIVEEALIKAKLKIRKLESRELRTEENKRGIKSDEEAKRLERENKILRGELKNMNHNLNLIFQQFDSADFERKKSKRPVSKVRVKNTYSEEMKNTEKLLYNLMHQHERLSRRVEKVGDINYQLELRKAIAHREARLTELHKDLKRLHNAQRERQKRMDELEINSHKECYAKVQDLTAQIAANLDRINKTEKESQRQKDVKEKMNQHLQSVRNTHDSLMEIAKHYQVDVLGVSAIPSQNQQKLQTKAANLEKKLKHVEHDFERVRLKNRIGELKKTKKMLLGRKQQLVREFRAKEELSHMSHGVLRNLIQKFKNTGDRSTLEIVERWENNNESLLALPPSDPKLNFIQQRSAGNLVTYSQMKSTDQSRQFPNAMELISPISDLPRNEDVRPKIKAYSNKETIQNFEHLEDKQSHRMKKSSKPFHIRKVSSKEPHKSSGTLMIEDDNISEEMEPLETTNTKEKMEVQKEPFIEKTTYEPPNLKPAANYKPVFAKPMMKKKPFGKPQMKSPARISAQKPRESQELLPRRSHKPKEDEEEVPFSQMFGIQQDAPKKEILPSPFKIEEYLAQQKEELKTEVPNQVRRVITPKKNEEITIARKKDIITSEEKQFWGENGAGGGEEEVIDFDDLQF